MFVFLCPQNGIVLPQKMMVKSLEWHKMARSIGIPCWVAKWRIHILEEMLTEEHPREFGMSFRAIWDCLNMEYPDFQRFTILRFQVFDGNFGRLYERYYVYNIYIYIINQFLNKPNFDLTVLMEFRHCWNSIWDTPELYWARSSPQTSSCKQLSASHPAWHRFSKWCFEKPPQIGKRWNVESMFFSCFFPNLPNL